VSDYVRVVDRARAIGADVVNSLPAGDEGTVAEQVEAQAGERLARVAAELDYDVDAFRQLVEREVKRHSESDGE
jgi:hypothetical protein